jgi:hypothetical protein
MQESFYEIGNCVQIICAIQGVHPRESGPKRVQNPPEHPAKRAQTTLGKARRCNTIAYLRKSTGCRFESCPVHHSKLSTYSAPGFLRKKPVQGLFQGVHRPHEGHQLVKDPFTKSYSMAPHSLTNASSLLYRITFLPVTHASSRRKRYRNGRAPCSTVLSSNR